MGSTVLSSSQQSGVPLALSERTGGDLVEDTVADGSGGIWITGRTSGGLAVTPDALHRIPPGDWDIFLSHIGADGRLLYATYLGGKSTDEVYGIARDTWGNLYITGMTGSDDFPNTTGAVRNGFRDAFVVKLDPAGRQILYSTYFGGASFDQGNAIAVDAAGFAHVVGRTGGYGFPITWGRCIELWTNAFHVRLSSNGTIQNAACLDDADASAVAVDANGDAYVVGKAGPRYGPRMGQTSVLKATYPAGSSSQGFLAKFSGNSLPFSTYLGGSKDDWATDVAVTSKGIYISGAGNSVDYPSAGRDTSLAGNYTGWIMKIRLDGVAVLGTTLIDGRDGHEYASSLEVDASEFVHATGYTNSNTLPVTADAAQRLRTGQFSSFEAFYAKIWAPTNTIGDPSYLSYFGGPSDDRAESLALDGSGGAWIGGNSFQSTQPGESVPLINATLNSPTPPFVARFGQPRPVPQAGNGDIVLYSRDASATVGEWEQVADASAAGGTRAWNPDTGAPKVTVPAAASAHYFEVTFQASAGVPYHLWLRMKADNDHWANDSVWVQFSDSVDASGAPMWQIGSTSATFVSLEDCSGCGEQGWGWNDNGYDSVAVPVRFASTGTHTIRIQQREDGVSIDQIVLSSEQWATTAPGASRYDAMILAQTAAPPSPPDAREVVMYVASDRSAGGTNWQSIADATAAGGSRLFNPDSGQPKSSSPSASASDYFEVQFTAEAGVPYHLWVRSQALNDHWTNDSVFVQFSDSVDADGTPTFRIGTDTATYVSLEDCSGCGEQGWGWNDNAYGGFAAPIYFAKSGPQTIRILRREDGISIDQIVLSAGKYLNAAPGAARNDTTIVAK